MKTIHIARIFLCIALFLGFVGCTNAPASDTISHPTNECADSVADSFEQNEVNGDSELPVSQNERLERKAVALAACIARCPDFTPDSSMDDFRGEKHISVLFSIGSHNASCDFMGNEGPRLFADRVLITDSVTPEIFISLENANEIAFELYGFENWSDSLPNIEDYLITNNEQVGFRRPFEIGVLVNDTELVEIYCGENQINVVMNVSPSVIGDVPLPPDYKLELSFRVLPDESLQLIGIS